MRRTFHNTKVSVKLRKSNRADEWYLVVESYPVYEKFSDKPKRIRENINYNPQNEMFSHLGTKRYNFKNETQLFKVIPHTSKFQKNRPASPERNTFEGS